MRSRIVFTFLLTALFVVLSGCGTAPNCPTCGTTTGGTYAVIDVIPVPEHNNTGEPGGPFNSFDISWIAQAPNGMGDDLDYVSDRIGIAVQVIDTAQDIAVNSIAGSNGISGAGNNASSCSNEVVTTPIPPIVSVLGNWTRFGCRNGNFHIPGFGANGNFGGFVGGQCCAARANQVNPLSGPNGVVVTADGNTLFVGNGSSSVVVFDLTTMNLAANPPTGPNVIAVIPTGLSPDYDGQAGNSNPLPWNPSGNQAGIAPCIASANGRAFSDPSCGDLRGDEISYDATDHILAVIDGDPGLPFITFIDVSSLVTRPITSNCLPIDSTTPFGPPLGNALGLINPSTCIMGQIYYDGAGGLASGGTGMTYGLNPGTPVDTIALAPPSGQFPCPDPSNPQVNSGVSGIPGVNIVADATAPVPCHHGPLLTAAGVFCNQTDPGTGCSGAISPAGLGAHVWNPNTGHFLLTNANSTGNIPVGSIDEIDPRPGNPNGPVVINSAPLLNCMPGSIVQGPGDNFLVGCADHDGQAFPANEIVINGTTLATVATTYNVGGVDEIWYNPGDNRYYVAARDMLPYPVMGVIDAGTNLWLYNLQVNTNAHSIAVDPKNNHVFMPQQAGAICGTQASAGCIDVIAQQ